MKRNNREYKEIPVFDTYNDQIILAISIFTKYVHFTKFNV